MGGHQKTGGYCETATYLEVHKKTDVQSQGGTHIPLWNLWMSYHRSPSTISRLWIQCLFKQWSYSKMIINCPIWKHFYLKVCYPMSIICLLEHHLTGSSHNNYTGLAFVYMLNPCNMWHAQNYNYVVQFFWKIKMHLVTVKALPSKYYKSVFCLIFVTFERLYFCEPGWLLLRKDLHS